MPRYLPPALCDRRDYLDRNSLAKGAAMNKQQAGQRGGRETVRRHGREYMKWIGRRGAATTWTRYYLAPVGQTQYALIERATNKIISLREAR